MGDSNEELQAQKYMAEADKKASGGRSGGFLGGIFGGGGSKLDEAIELYCKAANNFKMAKNWNGAGEAFTRAAKLNFTTDTKHEAASKYIDASTCFRKVNPQQAIECLKKAVEIQTEMGRFNMAAKQHTTIAEIYEELKDIDQAIIHYEKAADYHSGEESQSAASKCLLKVAHYAAEKENYQKAIQIFEQVAKRHADTALLKYSAKDYYFKAGLCHLCVDIINAQHALTRYITEYPALQDSREYKLLQTLIGHMEEANVEAFTEAVKEYDNVTRLEPWTTQLLLRIKRTLGGEADLT